MWFVNNGIIDPFAEKNVNVFPLVGKIHFSCGIENEGITFVASIGSGYPLPYFRPPALRRIG